jgi:transposase
MVPGFQWCLGPRRLHWLDSISPLPPALSHKGNRQMRRVLSQAANAAVKAKGTIFAIVYRRLVPRLGHAQAIGAITHRLCRLIWKILHQGVRYEERGPAVSEEAKKVRARKMIRELRSLGYRVERLPAPSSSPA